MPSKHELDQLLTNKLIELLQKGKKISAIKVHMKVTGGGLKESKEYIEQFARDHNIKRNSSSATTNKKCFIATACYEHEDALEVELFRTYRDTYLMKHILGRLFVRAYYYVSPSLVKPLSRSSTLKHWVQSHLLDPLLRSIIKNHSLFE